MQEIIYQILEENTGEWMSTNDIKRILNVDTDGVRRSMKALSIMDDIYVCKGKENGNCVVQAQHIGDTS